MDGTDEAWVDGNDGKQLLPPHLPLTAPSDLSLSLSVYVSVYVLVYLFCAWCVLCDVSVRETVGDGVIDLKVRVIICSGTESVVSLPDGKAKLLMFIAVAVFNFIYVLLSSASLPSNTLFDLFVGILKSDQEIMDSVKDNLKAVKERDPACINHVHCFLNFKGFLACQSHRVAHKLWLQGRKVLAVMIQNRVSEIFAVRIHPGAKIGSGIMLDHVTGLVVGETAVIGNIVSILHSVTLGGTGKASGDRHPKIGDGILIGAGTCILGNIKVGECAKIGADSVVIKYVPPRTTVVSDFVIFYDVCI
nr:serine acetyltransferase 3, mitochondrial-like [Arachis hypogaea]